MEKIVIAEVATRFIGYLVVLVGGGVVAAVIPPILLVRLRSHQPDGTRVGERDRTCHVVPAPDSDEVPEVLRPTAVPRSCRAPQTYWTA